MKEVYRFHIHVLRKIISILFVVSLALFFYFLGEINTLFILLALTVVFVPLDIVHYFTKGKNRISRLFFETYPKKRAEYGQYVSDASIFFISTIIMVLFFDKDIVFLSLLIFIFTDASEQIFGNLFPSKGFLWNKKKGWIGTLSGFLIAMAVSFSIMGVFFIEIAFWRILFSCAVAAILGLSRKYDNVLIPWGAAIVLFLT